MHLVLDKIVCTRNNFQLHLNCAFRSNCITTIVGKSGAGKTSLLHAIAGFLPLTRGRILYEDREIHTQRLEERNIGVIFQDYALFPHLCVFDNVAYGLRMRKAPQSTINERVTELLDACMLKTFAKRAVSSLSGGEQQRVAIARALAWGPSILLCDEALGALEGSMRSAMQELLWKYVAQNNATLLYVTHNREEALSLGDDVFGLEDGRILMHGSAESLYYHPDTRAAAALLGEYSALKSRIVTKRDTQWILEHQEWGQFACFAAKDIHANVGDTLHAIVRPEHVSLLPNEASVQKDRYKDGLCVPAKIYTRRFYGFYWMLELGPLDQAMHSARVFKALKAITHTRIESDTCLMCVLPEHIIPVREV